MSSPNNPIQNFPKHVESPKALKLPAIPQQLGAAVDSVYDFQSSSSVIQRVVNTGQVLDCGIVILPPRHLSNRKIYFGCFAPLAPYIVDSRSSIIFELDFFLSDTLVSSIRITACSGPNGVNGGAPGDRTVSNQVTLKNNLFGVVSNGNVLSLARGLSTSYAGHHLFSYDDKKDSIGVSVAPNSANGQLYDILFPLKTKMKVDTIKLKQLGGWIGEGLPFTVFVAIESTN